MVILNHTWLAVFQQHYLINFLTFHSAFRCILACRRRMSPVGQCPGSRCRRTYKQRAQTTGPRSHINAVHEAVGLRWVNGHQAGHTLTQGMN